MQFPRQLAAQGQNEANKRFDLAILLGLEAGQRTLGDSWTNGLLMEILQTNPRLTAYLRGHTDKVHSVAISPDGRTLASAGYDNTIILWDISQPDKPAQIGQPLNGHKKNVYSVAFSPDGKTLASGSSR